MSRQHKYSTERKQKLPANPPSSLADVIYGWFLSKQLALKQFQHLDWATNASMLSQHYLANEDYSTTKRHLIG